jgi:hypothetical protein
MITWPTSKPNGLRLIDLADFRSASCVAVPLSGCSSGKHTWFASTSPFASCDIDTVMEAPSWRLLCIYIVPARRQNPQSKELTTCTGHHLEIAIHNERSCRLYTDFWPSTVITTTSCSSAGTAGLPLQQSVARHPPTPPDSKSKSRRVCGPSTCPSDAGAGPRCPTR